MTMFGTSRFLRFLIADSYEFTVTIPFEASEFIYLFHGLRVLDFPRFRSVPFLGHSFQCSFCLMCIRDQNFRPESLHIFLKRGPRNWVDNWPRNFMHLMAVNRLAKSAADWVGSRETISKLLVLGKSWK